MRVSDQVVSDRELVEGLVHRDAEALAQLYDRYSRTVYSLLLRMTAEPAAAEELLQEAFLRMWRHAGAFDAARGSLATWLLTLARNLAIDHARSKGEKQRRREDVPVTLPSPVVPPKSEEWIDRRRQMERVRVIVGELPALQREALELAYFRGLSQSEIAAAMNEPLGTVKTWVRTALLRLRRELEAVS